MRTVLRNLLKRRTSAAVPSIPHVFVVTPWQKVKVPLQPDAWRIVELTIPEGLQLETVDAEIVTFDHWFLAEECGTADNRCLGVLVREEDGAVEDTTPPWRAFMPFDATDAARLADFRYQAPKPLWGEWRVD